MTLERVVILPHPPIALPEVAGSRFGDVKITAMGMQELAADLIATGPETIIVITPHSSMHPRAFATYIDEEILGGFAMFGAPEVKLKVKNDLDMIKTIETIRNEEGYHDIVYIKPGNHMDHGSGVPLYYIFKAGYKGSVVIFNYCHGNNDKHKGFGKSLVKAAENSNKKVALIASGDLSHRVIPSAPAGYHPDGEKFDALIVKAVQEGDYDRITSMDLSLRENAGECAYNSLMVAFGAIEDTRKNNKVYSYEAPFGVGYLVASL